MTERTTRRAWVLAIFLFVLGDGVTLQTRGPLLRSFEAEFGVSEALLGLVSPAGTIGFVVAVLLAGLLAGRIDIKRWLMAGIALTALSLLLMSGAPVYWLFLAFLLAQGSATGVVRGLDRAILSHLYPEGRARIFTLHALVWAIGAVSGPLFINATLARADWRAAYAVLGLFFIPLVLLVWRARLPGDLEAERALSIAALRDLVRRPVMIGMVIGVTLAGAAEGIVFTWLPFYASTFIPREDANVLLTLFLAAYVPARILYTYLLRHVGSLPLAVVLTAGFIPALGVALLGATGPVLVASVFFAGFFAAGAFPLIPSFGVDAAPRYAGPVLALATGGYYLGLALGPVVVGGVAEVAGIAAAMPLAVALAVGCFLSIAGTYLLERRSSGPGAI